MCVLKSLSLSFLFFFFGLICNPMRTIKFVTLNQNISKCTTSITNTRVQYVYFFYLHRWSSCHRVSALRVYSVSCTVEKIENKYIINEIISTRARDQGQIKRVKPELKRGQWGGVPKPFHYLLCISRTATTITSMTAPPTIAPITIIELFWAWYSAVEQNNNKRQPSLAHINNPEMDKISGNGPWSCFLQFSLLSSQMVRFYTHNETITGHSTCTSLMREVKEGGNMIWRAFHILARGWTTDIVLDTFGHILKSGNILLPTHFIIAHFHKEITDCLETHLESHF